MKTKLLLSSLVLLFLSTIKLNAQSGNDLVLWASGFDHPVKIAHCGDNRLFVVEKDGIINIIDSAGNINPIPFLDITSIVNSGTSERGLLGLAFHPQYPDSNYFYVNYTGSTGSTHVSRFSVDLSNPDVAVDTSEKNLMEISQPFANHNGGDIHFGPDGYLYIGMGDGGSGGDPGNRAQDSLNLLGKMLRIDVDHGDPYAIPSDNPFVGNPDGLDEIWATGLRNPWRYSFDRETGDLWIADVGQSQYEEVNFEPAGSAGGLNYGWRCYEGNVSYNTGDCGEISLYTFPVGVYSHSFGCSVTGGFVYRGSMFPVLYGRYFYGDYCTDRIWTIHDDGGSWVTEDFGQFQTNRFSAFGENAAGELFVAGYTSGDVYRIVDSSSVINLDVKVFLEGPFNSTEMATLLNSGGDIPLNQPFNTDPWNYEGDESVASIPNEDVVDWVLIELRDAKNADAADGAARIAQKAAFLLKDGNVVGLDGVDAPQFNNFVNHQLFVVVMHRNHLGVMSAIPLLGSGNSYSYDFSSNGDKAYGDGTAQNEIVSGIWGMVAGDSDGNGIIEDPDKMVNWDTEAGMPGYLNSDFELNRQVNNQDKNDFWVPNYLRSSQIP
ncbi:MAG: PQQ-dependent sugar dehydrogenase [Bacteroidales bacterium]|nr:PQQ-dependent sugar dehydrogenase [Bacteroidales bacterium]